jgi:hypothetical protein
VDGAGDQLLSGAGLAPNEHRRVRVGNASHEVANPLHLGGFPHDGGKPLRPVDARAQAHDLPAEREPLPYPLHRRQEQLGAQLVLEHVVRGSEAHRRADLGDLARRGDHDDVQRGELRAKLPEELETAAVLRVPREANVEQDEIGLYLLGRGERGDHRVCLADLHVFERAEELEDEASNAALIVDDEDLHRVLVHDVTASTQGLSEALRFTRGARSLLRRAFMSSTHSRL